MYLNKCILRHTGNWTKVTVMCAKRIQKMDSTKP